MAKLPAKRQNLLFSATMPPEIRKIADQLLVQPAVVQVSNTAPPEKIRHALYPVSAGQKMALLEAYLGRTPHDCVLIFTRTKHRAKSLARKLEQKGMLATSLQGNLSQNRRQEALEGFRCGKYRIMVATDIAARGIDCVRISHVVNFDLPDTAESYTHRIGRTGRADKSGEAITLVTPEDTAQMNAIERILGGRLERVRIEGFAYSTGGDEASFEEARPARNPRTPGRNAPSGRTAPSGRSSRPASRSASDSRTPQARSGQSRRSSSAGRSVFGMAGAAS
jgi:superfamily II DNA/RNA helicase